MRELTITTCQAPIAERCVALLAIYLAEQLARPVRFVDDCSWQERARLLDSGVIDLAWICGTPYVRRVDTLQPTVTLLVAPVQAAARYGGRPVYFSDVVVRAQSPLHHFADLRGRRWGYNEPNSHSGYFLFRSYLVERGETTAFFGQIVETGGHQQSLALILGGQLDASAIDSTVLDLLLRDDPALATDIRLIATLGPSSGPPWVASLQLEATLREQVRAALLAAHTQQRGQAALAAGGLARFAAVDDQDYNDIRRMAALAALAGP